MCDERAVCTPQHTACRYPHTHGASLQARQLTELRIEDPQKYFRRVDGAAAAVKGDPEAAAALMHGGSPLTALTAVAAEHARLRSAGGDSGGVVLGAVAPDAAAAALRDVQECSQVDGAVDAGGRRRNPVAGARSSPAVVGWQSRMRYAMWWARAWGVWRTARARVGAMLPQPYRMHSPDTSAWRGTWYLAAYHDNAFVHLGKSLHFQSVRRRRMFQSSAVASSCRGKGECGGRSGAPFGRALLLHLRFCKGCLMATLHHCAAPPRQTLLQPATISQRCGGHA